jgi:tetratricopeptide (TPR) repeat protein
LQAQNTEEAAALLTLTDEGPVEVLAVSARLHAHKGDTERATRFAQHALDRLEATDAPSLTASEIESLARLCLKLGQLPEAVRFAQTAVEACPGSPALLNLLGEAHSAAGNAREAAQAYQMAALLQPGNPDLRRKLATALGTAGEWVSAMHEQGLLAASNPNNIDDILAYASCALKAGQPEVAIESCHDALLQFSEDGRIHACLAAALAAQGSYAASLEHYHQATNLSPYLAGPWLAMARLQSENGNCQAGLDTLRSAALAVPDNPEVYLALGEAYLADWEGRGNPALTQALEMLRRAFHLCKSTAVDLEAQIRIALRFGETLYSLGHTSEARQALQPAYHQRPKTPGLAYAYARTLIAQKDYPEALPALTLALESSPNNPQIGLDFARAILEVGEDPAQAVPVLHRVLTALPGHPVAQALLAEALFATGEHESALRMYQSALESNLVEDPAWSSRLSMGLGRAALALGQPDIAIAALNEAAQAEPEEAAIQKALSDAYQSAGLPEDAVQAARLALRMAPDDVDQLTWFAEKVIQLHGYTFLSTKNGSGAEKPDHSVKDEAINAYTRAIQLAPDRMDLIIHLARIQRLGGDIEGALAGLRKVAMADRATPTDLNQAARALLELKDAPNAIACLEKALHISQGEAFDASEPGSLAYTLLEAYQQTGNTQAALSVADQAISFAPDSARLYQTKASLLLDMGRPTEALACLDEALKNLLNPAGLVEINLISALILRSSGELAEAARHAEAALAEAQPGTNLHLTARILAADLARARLQPEHAEALLGCLPLHELDPRLIPAFRVFEYACLVAELALGSGDEARAAEWAETASKISARIPVHTYEHTFLARLESIYSRLAQRRGSCEEALQRLQNGMSEAGSVQVTLALPSHSIQACLDAAPISNGSYLFSLAQAALECTQWDVAIYLLRHRLLTGHKEALLQLELAKALVLRAEAQQIMQAAGTVRHAPGASALAQYAAESWQMALQAAQDGISPGSPALSENPSQTGQNELLRWKTRGQAVFFPSIESCQALANMPIYPLLPDDVAAQVAAVTQLLSETSRVSALSQLQEDVISKEVASDLIETVTREFSHHPLVLAQVALFQSLWPERREAALTTIQEATHLLLQLPGKLELPGKEDLSGKLVQPGETACSPFNFLPYPVWQALLAQIAWQCGDSARALHASHAALAAWPDEARWHALAAEIYIAGGESSQALPHLEQASGLEPGNYRHYLALGQAYSAEAYRNEAYVNQAVQALDRASQLAPEAIEPWIELSKAYQRAGDIKSASNCCEQALTLAPNAVEPILQKAEISLSSDDPEEAYHCLSAILNQSGQANSQARLLMARALEGMGRGEEALSLLEETSQSSDNPMPMLLQRIQLLYRLRGPEVSTQATMELAQKYPDEPLVLASLARALDAAGQKDNAIRTAQKALQAAQSMDATRGTHQNLNAEQRARLHMLAGRLLRQTGQLDQSVQHLSESLRLDPGDVDTYLELGRAHQERRQHNLAINIFNQATNIAPRDPRPYYHAGLALKDSKDYQAAEEMLRRAADLAPSDLSIHRQLGAVVALNLVHNRRHNL